MATTRERKEQQDQTELDERSVRNTGGAPAADIKSPDLPEPNVSGEEAENRRNPQTGELYRDPETEDSDQQDNDEEEGGDEDSTDLPATRKENR